MAKKGNNAAELRGKAAAAAKKSKPWKVAAATASVNNSKNMKSTKTEKNSHNKKNQSTETQMTTTTTNKNGSKLSSLQQQFQKKLEGARFRSINEELYTRPGNVSFKEFQRDPSQFEAYHRGYREQVIGWPTNPLDAIINFLNQHMPSTAIVADMGCGEARLMESVHQTTVHAFDLVAANPKVTPCDIAHVPLKAKSVDVVVFCLSLMGTNMVDFLIEARRILKVGGLLIIVEVRSRFGDDSGIEKFHQFLLSAGFLLRSGSGSRLQLGGNKMFFDCLATKSTDEVTNDLEFSLKACQYKKR